MTNSTKLPLQAVSLPSRTLRQASAVSQALGALDRDLGRPWQRSLWVLECPEGSDVPAFRIGVANDRRSRKRAYALASRVYGQCGYADSKNKMTLITNFDAQPETLTILAEDGHGRPAGTITLIFDKDQQLPCDQVFPEEVASLRRSGRRLVEVTRLAIAPEFQRSKILLTRMINFIFIYAVRVRAFTDFVVEVNPRHAGFYRRFLGFEQLGPERPCPRVQNAPAVLLRLDLAVYERELAAWADPKFRPDPRLLYSRFVGPKGECEVAQFLRGQHCPMSRVDVKFFGIQEKTSPSSNT